MNTDFLKKNWYLLTPAALVLVPLLMIAFCMVNYGYDFTESIKAVRHVGSTSTRYGQGFSERKFKMVRVGMDGKAVYNTLKTPMERNVPEDTEWRYSLPSSGTEYYHERIIIMEQDKNGIPRVKERISRFHTPD
ncbi:MAG TPA: hypothetical protein DDZ88_31140 [Verrucomicrobiales bacterium]|nr:hypothetical protein [Verrucomicrobiales bacterium]